MTQYIKRKYASNCILNLGEPIRKDQWEELNEEIKISSQEITSKFSKCKVTQKDRNITYGVIFKT